jgi:hypothetical protein
VKYLLDFNWGGCRLAHGTTKQDAIDDALRAAQATRSCLNVLDTHFKRVGSVSFDADGKAVYIPAKVQP